MQIFFFFCSVTGTKAVKLEVCVGKQVNKGSVKAAKRNLTSDLEVKLDEFRKELAAGSGGVFPHAVLSAQQICTLSTQKPTNINEVYFHLWLTTFTSLNR